jgi:hypothetical protein
MTCPEARESSCPRCWTTRCPPPSARRSTPPRDVRRVRAGADGLRETVALLERLPPVHAPAGFVDRVVETAYRPSWPRRVADALFRPLRVKLPLEAAAVVLVGISALYVYRHAPEVQQVARQETREAPASAPSRTAPPPPPSTTSEVSQASPASDAAPPPESGVAERRRSGSPARPRRRRRFRLRPRRAARTRTSRRPRPRPARRPARRRRPRSRRSRRGRGQEGDRRPAAGRHGGRDVSVRRPSEAEPVSRASAVAGCRRIARGGRRRPRSPRHRPRGVARPRGRCGRGLGRRPRPSAAPAPFSAAKSRAAARLMRAVDASGRLVVSAPSRPRSPRLRCWDAWAAPVWRGGSRGRRG